MLRKTWEVLESGRLGRVIMMFLVTASTAYGFGGQWKQVILVGICGAFLALGGFYIDYHFDRQKDKISGKTLNPIATGKISKHTGILLIIIGCSASGVIGLLINPMILLPWLFVILVIIGMAQGFLDTPILRAISLGILQGLYVIIGGIASGNFNFGVLLIALFLLFAMTGGRVMGDVRDLPHDIKANTLTIPQKYGLVWSKIFLIINEIIAYIVAISVYWIGALSIGYFYCMLLIAVIGTIINLVFIIRTTPRIADITNKLSLGVLGMLYVLGMILGRK
jgi:4-hydroxybenzoate polyprenyltransferase